MNLPRQVVMKEVGPRDGLQNERQKILTEDKISFINQLSESGLKYIEVTSFVHRNGFRNLLMQRMFFNRLSVIKQSHMPHWSRICEGLFVLLKRKWMR